MIKYSTWSQFGNSSVREFQLVTSYTVEAKNDGPLFSRAPEVTYYIWKVNTVDTCGKSHVLSTSPNPQNYCQWISDEEVEQAKARK